MDNHDITSTFLWFWARFQDILGVCFRILDSFVFNINGYSSFTLLDVVLALLIIGVGLSVTLAVMKGGVRTSRYYGRREFYRSRRKD